MIKHMSGRPNTIGFGKIMIRYIRKMVHMHVFFKSMGHEAVLIHRPIIWADHCKVKDSNAAQQESCYKGGLSQSWVGKLIDLTLFTQYIYA